MGLSFSKIQQALFVIGFLMVSAKGPAQTACDSLLTAFYTFKNGTQDESGNGHHGSLIGNGQVDAHLIIPADNVSAMILPAVTLHGAVDFTFSCWVKFFKIHEAAPDPINILINGFSNNNAFVIGYRKPGNVVHLTFGGTGTDVPLPFEPVENQWYCFVFVRQQGSGYVYMDGVRMNNGASIGVSPLFINTLLLGQDQDCDGGCFATNQSLAGTINQVRIYRRALSETEVQSLCAFVEVDAVICEGRSFENHEHAGEYAEVFQSWGGCDSMRLLRLEILPGSDTVLLKTICQGEEFEGHRATGRYIDVFRAANGCDSLRMLYLEVVPGVYAPNVFSPNSDGINDHFTLFGGGENSLISTMKIFSRWGELVFEKSDIPLNQPQLGWDGRFKGKPCHPGVYAWFANVVLFEGKTLLLSGDVSILGSPGK